MSDSAGTLEYVLSKVPSAFRGRIIERYLELKHRSQRATHDKGYDACGLTAGKFCETLIRFLQHDLTGEYIPFGNKIGNFEQEASKLGKLPKEKGSDSVRLFIPNILTIIYSIRNKRGIGHEFGDLDANLMDISTVVKLADWVICELIRVYHNISIEEAQSIVDVLSTRSVPDIWEVNGIKRVLRNDLSFRDKSLFIAYSCLEIGIALEDLLLSVEYSSPSMFKKNIVIPLHSERLIEYDKSINYIFISPTGVKLVEEKILTKLF